ncbi:MAG: hypothetical protein ACE5D8_02240 [Fidelibacterota bacterium]
MILPIIKTVHIFSLATWFGSALVLEYLNRRSSDDTALKTLLVGRYAFWAGLGLIITGTIMLMDQTAFLKMGWLHTKLLTILLLMGLGHMAKGALRKDAGNIRKQLLFNRLIMAGLVLAVLLVELKPF